MKLKINNSWYWTVGDRYWRGEGYTREGVGINKKYLLGKELTLEIDKKEYHLDCEKAREFIVAHKSAETIKDARICYVPRSLLNEKKDSRSIQEKTMADIQPIHKEERQGDLFHLREEVRPEGLSGGTFYPPGLGGISSVLP